MRRPRRRRRAAATWARAAACLVLGVSAAWAGGARDLEDGWLLSPARLASARADSSGRGRPAGGGWLRLGCGRLHGMTELPQVAAALGGILRGVAVEAAWQRLGADLYREETWTLRAGLRGRWALHLVGLRRREEFGPEAARTGLSLAVELGGPLRGDTRWRLRSSLVEPPFAAADPRVRRWAAVDGAGVDWVWTLTVDRGESGPRLGGAVMILPGRVVGVGLRCDPATGTVGVTTAWRSGGWLVRSSHLVHPELGATHRWSLARGGWREVWW